jgi:hypothetical protein
MEVEKKESMKEAQKKYREANKEKIAERAKEKKYWKTYYDANKEKIRLKNLERYYERVGLVKKDDAPATNETILKLEGLLKDLREFVPLVRKKKEPKVAESI